MLTELGPRTRKYVDQIKRQPFLIALSAIFIVAVAVADAMLIVYLKEGDLADGRRETSNLAYVLAEQTDRGLQSANLVALDVVRSFASLGITGSSDFEAASSGTRVEDYLREKTSGIPQIANVAIIGTSGKLINRTRLGESLIFDFSQRDYFVALRDQPSLPYYISSPSRSRTTGLWNIVLAHAVRSAPGDFIGVVAVVIELKTMEELYSKIRLGKNGSIAMFRSDGVLLTRYPRIESLLGTSNASSPLFTEYVFKGANVALLRQMSRLDGADRIIAGNRTPTFPVVITVSASVDDLLADWRGRAKALIVAGLIAAAAILASALMLARRTDELASATSKLAAAHERESAQAAVEAEHNRFIAAISNMGQGLVMFDADEKLIVCNRRYAEMYKLPEDLTDPGTPRTDILKCREQMATDREGQSHFRDSALMEMNREHVLRDGRIVAVVHRPMLDGGWVSTHEDVTERRQVESKVAHMAEHDPLTDLPNRLHFRRKLEESLRELHEGARFALLYVDLDHFKNVNDNMGHPTGDSLLQLVAQRLRSVIRPTDTLARVGGDEFIVIQKVQTDGDAAALASRLIETVSAPYEVGGGHVVIGATVGISQAPENGVQPDELVRHADLALYQAKATERGSFQLFSPEMEACLAARRDLERELRQALLRNEFELYYQPLVCLADLTITAFEALLRWNHPERGVLAPGEFVTAAEETGLILPIGEWAVRQACMQAALWPQHVRVAVNVSAVQFRSSSFVLAVSAALRDSGVHPSRLEIEVTETVMLHEADNSVAILHQLRAMGIKVVMDDFGTGYSSLSYLRLFPFDKLKIDQSFVQGLGSNNECEAIVSAAVKLAVKLKMTTVAEGIETKGQLLRATREGCTEGQGYLFGGPVPADRLELDPMLNKDNQLIA